MNRNRIHELAAFRADLDNQIDRTLPRDESQAKTQKEKNAILINNKKRTLLSYIRNVCNADAENDLRNSLLEEESLSSFDIYNKHISERQRRRIEKTKNVNISEVKARADQMVGSILLTHLTENEPQKGIYPVKELLHMNDQEIEKRKNKAITEENKERTKQNLNVQDILIAPEVNTYTTALEEETGKKAANRAKVKAAKQANVNNQEPTAQTTQAKQTTSNNSSETKQPKTPTPSAVIVSKNRNRAKAEQTTNQQPKVEEVQVTPIETQNNARTSMLEKLFGKTTESSTPAKQPTSNPRTEQQPKVEPEVPTSTNRERGETTNNNPKEQEFKRQKLAKKNQQPQEIVATKSAMPVSVDKTTGKAFVNGRFIGAYYNPKTKTFQKSKPSEFRKREEQGNPGLTDEEMSDIQADEINF